MNASLTLNLLLSIWHDLVSKKISKNQLSLAKLKLKRSFLHSYRTCEDKIFRKVSLIGLGMDPYYDEKVEDLLETINPDQILSVSKKYLIYPCISISGKEELCKRLKEIWKKKY